MPFQKVVSFDVGSRNCAVCLLRAAPLQIVHWEVIDIVVERGLPQRSSCERLVRALIQCLCDRRDVFADFLDSETSVVVEQQPLSRGRGSPTMSALSHAICTWFLCQHPSGCPACHVGLIHAKAKLQIDTAAWGIDLSHATAKSTAASRRTAVWYGQGSDGPAVRDACRELVNKGTAHFAAVYDDQSNGISYSRVVFKAPRSASKSVLTALRCVSVEPKYGMTAPRETGQDLPTGSSRYGTRPTAPTARRKRRRAEYETYRRNKGFGVQVCQAFLLRMGDSVSAHATVFASSNKKDDLADSLVQGLTQLALVDAPRAPTASE